MSLSTDFEDAVDAVFDELDDALPSITHEAYEGQDDNLGNATYAAGVTRKALVEHKERWVKAAHLGGDQLSKTTVTVKADVKIQDRVTLPDGSQPQILTVEQPVKPDGTPYFTRIFF